MTLSFDMKVMIPKDILVKEVRGESVLLNLNKECYFGLDKVGTRMWSTLSESESISKAYDALLKRYDVGADVLRQDLHDLIEKLIGYGLLEVNE